MSVRLTGARQKVPLGLGQGSDTTPIMCWTIFFSRNMIFIDLWTPIKFYEDLTTHKEQEYVLFKLQFPFWMRSFLLQNDSFMLGKFCGPLWNIDIIFWLGSSSVSMSMDGQTDQISSHVGSVSPLSICWDQRPGINISD